jgi:hypothetical protein
MVAGSIGALRSLLEKYVLPAPGEGPSPEAQLKGGFDLRFHGRTQQGDVLRTRVTATGIQVIVDGQDAGPGRGLPGGDSKKQWRGSDAATAQRPDRRTVPGQLG